MKANIEGLIDKIREKNMKVGLALKPKTQIDERIMDLINRNLLDLVLVMTVGDLIFF